MASRGQPTTSDFGSIPDSAVEQAFQASSMDARDTLEALGLAPGEQLPREEVPEVLRRAAGLPALSGTDAAAVLRAYRLDASGLISKAEFMASWRALQQLTSASSGGGAGSAAAKRRPGALGAAPRQAPALASQPLTAAAEVGWGHASAPLPKEPGSVPNFVLRSSDVTRGEGRSAATHFGMHLC